MCKMNNNSHVEHSCFTNHKQQNQKHGLIVATGATVSRRSRVKVEERDGEGAERRQAEGIQGPAFTHTEFSLDGELR